MKHLRFAFAFLLVALAPLHASAQRIDPAGIEGAILACGSYKASPEMFDAFVDLAGGAKAKIVVMTFEKAKYGGPPLEALKAAAMKKNAAEPIVVDYSEVKDKFPEATGLWLHVDSVSPMPRVMNERVLDKPCQAILKRGGVIASAAAGVRYLGSRELAINTVPGLNLLPDAMLDPRGKLKFSALTKSPTRWKNLVGYEIEADTALLVKGRTLSAIGPGTVRVYLPAGNGLPIREIPLQGKAKEDLTALRRAALDRFQEFPPKNPGEPFVEKGTLVIVGGGGSPDGLYKKFVEYAGGEGKANIVVFPTAADPILKRDSLSALFKKAGAKKVTILYGKTQAEVESPEFLDALKEATGIWFDGGRQWRFVDCYENTKALPLLFDVLQRGGVIGGTSAGATIQGDYLARGGVFNNFDIRYEGYERGLGFLKGVAIDQHFTQRKRQADMTQLMKVYPQYLGIGIDEATALVVQGSVGEVIGKGKVHFYDARRKVEPGQPDFEALSAGGRYDLKLRKTLP